MTRTMNFAFAAAVALCGTLTVSSQAITLSGNVAMVAPLADVRVGGSPNNDNIRVFVEKTGVLAAPLAVDFTAPGTYTSRPTAVILPKGQNYKDYFFHSENRTGTNSRTYSGSITFDSPILGVIFSTGLLTLSDIPLGLPTTQYPTLDIYRGLEFNGGEKVKFTGPNTLDFTFVTAGNVDQMRVLTAGTADVPEPGSIALLCGLGVAGLGVLRTRRRK